MAITFQQAANAQLVASRSPSITYSTAPATDDVLIWFISGGTDFTPTVPGDWENPLGGNVYEFSTQNTGMMIGHRVTSGEAGSSTVTWTLTNFFATTETGNITSVVLRGVQSTGAIFDVGAAGSSSTNVTPFVLPQVTPTNTGDMVVAGVGKDTTGTYTDPSGWTVRSTQNYTCGAWLGTYDTATTASSAVGPTNITPSASDQYAAISAVVIAAATSLAIAPTGASVTVTPGTPDIDRTVTPTGVTISVTPGTATVTQSQPITPTGPTVTVTPGTVALGLAFAVTGPTVTVTAGTLLVAEDQAITPSGPTVTVTAGTLGLDLNVTPTGPAVTVAPGTPTLDRTITPTGPTVSVTAGTLQVDQGQSISLTGPTVGVTAGSTTVTSGAALVFDGPTVTVTAGTLELDLGFAPTGPTVTVTPGTPVVTLNQATTPDGPTVSVTPGTVGLALGFTVAGPTVTVTAGEPSLDLAMSLAGATVAVTAGTVVVGDTVIVTPWLHGMRAIRGNARPAIVGNDRAAIIGRTPGTISGGPS